MSTPEQIVVVAAVIERDGRICVTRRPAGTHLAGYWEFPGGKQEAGEDHQRCLERELREELSVGAVVGAPLHRTRFAYPDRTVELHFYRCVIDAEPSPQLGQEIRWVSRDQLGALQFPPADRELITKLTATQKERS